MAAGRGPGTRQGRHGQMALPKTATFPCPQKMCDVLASVFQEEKAGRLETSISSQSRCVVDLWATSSLDVHWVTLCMSIEQIQTQ